MFFYSEFRQLEVCFAIGYIFTELIFLPLRSLYELYRFFRCRAKLVKEYVNNKYSATKTDTVLSPLQRARTKQVYTMYSRKPAQEIWQNYNDLQVDYAILEEAWCARRSK